MHFTASQSKKSAHCKAAGTSLNSTVLKWVEDEANAVLFSIKAKAGSRC